jgi:hypothetical protein
MTGTHKCGGQCVPDGDVTACGTTCTACPTDPNGVAQCIAGECGVACKSGFHTCGGRCVTNSDTGSCGTSSCEACQAPTGGTATCDGTSCVGACPGGMKLCSGACIDMTAACSGTCPSGTHNCNGICASNNSVNSCGAGSDSCSPCPKPTGASATSCDGTTCDFTCASGYHRCGKACSADNDPTACGSMCMNCPSDPSGLAACVAGVCGLMCNSGFHVCNNQCVSNKAPSTCGATAHPAPPVRYPLGAPSRVTDCPVFLLVQVAASCATAVALPIPLLATVSAPWGPTIVLQSANRTAAQVFVVKVVTGVPRQRPTGPRYAVQGEYVVSRVTLASRTAQIRASASQFPQGAVQVANASPEVPTVPGSVARRIPAATLVRVVSRCVGAHAFRLRAAAQTVIVLVVPRIRRRLAIQRHTLAATHALRPRRRAVQCA